MELREPAKVQDGRELRVSVEVHDRIGLCYDLVHRLHGTKGWVTLGGKWAEEGAGTARARTRMAEEGGDNRGRDLTRDERLYQIRGKGTAGKEQEAERVALP